MVKVPWPRQLRRLFGSSIRFFISKIVRIRKTCIIPPPLPPHLRGALKSQVRARWIPPPLYSAKAEAYSDYLGTKQRCTWLFFFRVQPEWCSNARGATAPRWQLPALPSNNTSERNILGKWLLQGIFCTETNAFEGRGLASFQNSKSIPIEKVYWCSWLSSA